MDEEKAEKERKNDIPYIHIEFQIQKQKQTHKQE